MPQGWRCQLRFHLQVWAFCELCAANIAIYEANPRPFCVFDQLLDAERTVINCHEELKLPGFAPVYSI